MRGRLAPIKIVAIMATILLLGWIGSSSLDRQAKCDYALRQPYALLQRVPEGSEDRAWLEDLIQARKDAECGAQVSPEYDDLNAVCDRLHQIERATTEVALAKRD